MELMEGMGRDERMKRGRSWQGADRAARKSTSTACEQAHRPSLYTVYGAAKYEYKAPAYGNTDDGVIAYPAIVFVVFIGQIIGTIGT